jgi:hypothetical protein
MEQEELLVLTQVATVVRVEILYLIPMELDQQ